MSFILTFSNYLGSPSVPRFSPAMSETQDHKEPREPDPSRVPMCQAGPPGGSLTGSLRASLEFASKSQFSYGESVSTICSLFPYCLSFFFRAFIILCLNRNHPSNFNLQGILSKKKERLSPGCVGI